MRTRTRPHSIGADEHLVTFEEPDGPPVPDGEGGYTQPWKALAPASWYVRIQPASAKTAEFLTAGTVITHVSHAIHGRYHPGVTTLARMHHAGRVYQITSVVNVDARDREMELIADLQD